MQFNSFLYLFLFLPLAILIYFWFLKKQWINQSHWFLILISFLFYGWANYYYAVLLFFSIVINYLIIIGMNKANKLLFRKIFLYLGISINIAVLLFFKYSNFIIENFNVILNTDKPYIYMGISLGVSFITFMQIAYIIQTFQGDIKEISFKEYALFASFFPKIINGPIAYFDEVIPQFKNDTSLKPNYDNISKGIFIISIGLFKKLAVADMLGLVVNRGYAVETLTMIEAWTTSLAYTFQIYFDFSGYIDIAIGSALLFNIELPINFNSPYRAIGIKDFWKRWHITLTRFLTTYIYIPLGGNRNGELIKYRNIMVTFLISGLWHGAGWTFVFWGFLHGLAMIIQNLWEKTDFKLPRFLSWFITFNFINFTWIFFKANTLEDAFKILAGMFGLTGLIGKSFLEGYGLFTVTLIGVAFIMAVIGLLKPDEFNKFKLSINPNMKTLIIQVLLIVVSIMYLNMSIPKEFIYNDF